ASEAAENSPSPAIRTRRRPSRSAARPPSRRSPPKVRAYAVTTHCRLVCEKCRSRPIVGSDTLTIVRSTIVMKYATASSANARQRLTWVGGDVIGPPGHEFAVQEVQRRASHELIGAISFGVARRLTL